MNGDWDFLVRRDRLAESLCRPFAAPSLDEGEVRLEVERFALTANNVTYGVAGDRLGYWRFYPAEAEWGRVPAWGFSRVLASRVEGIAEGTRLFGYVPMSTSYVTRLARTEAGIVDVSPHRAKLPPFYNQSAEAPERPIDDQIALLQPLFATSYLIDLYLSETAPDAAVILASASSKTALGLAYLLAKRGVRVIGLTSPRNRAFLQQTGWFAEIAGYDEVDGIAAAGQLGLFDFAGAGAVRAAIHQRFGDRLFESAIVGSTHVGSPPAGADPLPGPTPRLFFAPEHARLRAAAWGLDELNRRVGAALAAFIGAIPWLRVDVRTGPEGLASAWGDLLTGAADPARGLIVRPG